MDASLRCMTLLRVGVGGACIVSPRRVASAAAGRPAVTLACVFTRILGVRQLVQAALTVTTPDLMTPLRGAVIDGLHAATMVLLAAVSRRHRRAALVSTTMAATFCAVGMVRARDHRERPAARSEAATAPDPPLTATMPQPAIREEAFPVPQQHAERESEARRQERPRDDNRFGLGLDDDRNLEWAKLLAGVLSMVALVAMLITTQFRAPNPVATAVLAVLVIGLGLALGARVVRRRADQHE